MAWFKVQHITWAPLLASEFSYLFILDPITEIKISQVSYIHNQNLCALYVYKAKCTFVSHLFGIGTSYQ